MKAVILSDTHGSPDLVRKILEKEKNTDTVLFLGDGINDILAVEPKYPNINFCKVMGNCDFTNEYPTTLVQNFDGITIFLTHGHIQYVKHHLRELLSKAKEQGAKIAMFGHTHAPLKEAVNGVTLFNPGSVKGNRLGKSGNGYGVLLTDNGDFTLENCVL